MRIRQGQLDSLASHQRQAFEARFHEHLEAHFPEAAAWTVGERREFAANCIRDARIFGLTSEQAVVCFAHVRLVLGHDFERDPRWASFSDLLREQGLEPNERAKFALLMAHEFEARGLCDIFRSVAP